MSFHHKQGGEPPPSPPPLQGGRIALNQHEWGSSVEAPTPVKDEISRCRRFGRGGRSHFTADGEKGLFRLFSGCNDCGLRSFLPEGGGKRR